MALGYFNNKMTFEYSESNIDYLLHLDFDLYENELKKMMNNILNSQHPTEKVNNSNREKVKKALKMLDKDSEYKALLSHENIFYFNLFKKLYLDKGSFKVKF